MQEHLQWAEHSLRELPPAVTDGVPVLLQDVVGPISRALEQAFETDANFIQGLVEVRNGLQLNLEATVPVFAACGEDARMGGPRGNLLTPEAIDEAFRK